MTKTTKILLTVSLISFAISLTGAVWGLFLPAGAVTFGLFMISNMLGKEAALFDEEQHLRALLAGKNVLITQPSQPMRGRASLAPAHAH